MDNVAIEGSLGNGVSIVHNVETGKGNWRHHVPSSVSCDFSSSLSLTLYAACFGSYYSLLLYLLLSFSHLYAVLQFLLVWFVYDQVLCPISIGKLYHWIRGQAMLKLYVLIAIVEVFDRLLCSFGQDAWDSLYWNTTRRPRHPRMLVSVSFMPMSF